MTDDGQAEELDLVRSTDFDILRVFRDCRRYTSPLVAEEMGGDTNYISKRIGQLADQKVVRDVFETDRCRLYRITPYGLVVAAHLDVYEKKNTVHFMEAANTVAAQLNQLFGREDEKFTKTLDWHPRFIDVDQIYTDFFVEIGQNQPVGSQNLRIENYPIRTIGEQLYRLYFHGLIDRTGEGYVLTELGETVEKVLLGDGEIDVPPENKIELNIELTKRGDLEPPKWYNPELMSRLLLWDEQPIGIERTPVSEGYSESR